MNSMQIIPVKVTGEITGDTLLPPLLNQALEAEGEHIDDGDIIAVTQKIVSKAKGRLVDLASVEPSPFAETVAREYNKDPHHIEAILRESVRIVRMDRGVIIAETRDGFICANAGVDASNTGGKGRVTLLPEEPDMLAGRMRKEFEALTGKKNLGVIITDTWGRPWREGQVNFAIGSSGFTPLIEYAGQKDPYGFTLQVSAIAVADELAGAAELAMGKIDGIPAALIRGYAFEKNLDKGAQDLVREASMDMFR